MLYVSKIFISQKNITFFDGEIMKEEYYFTIMYYDVAC